MVQITPICRALALGTVALSLAAGPVHAASGVERYRPGPLSTFVGARAAVLNGDVRRAATLYAALAVAEPNNRLAVDRAISNALVAGNYPMALRLAKARPAQNQGTDARLLLAADALREGNAVQAIAAVTAGVGVELDFLVPLVWAWTMAARGDALNADVLATVPSDSTLAPYVDEQRALILLHLKQADAARPYIAKALLKAGERDTGLRLAFAEGLEASGDRAGAIALLAGQDAAFHLARAKIARGEPLGMRVDSAAAALAQVLTAVAMDLRRGNERALPFALIQVARFAAPDRADSAIVAGLLHVAAKRLDDGLVAFRQVRDDSPFVGTARDAEVRALLDADRKSEALARALAFVANGDSLADDHARVGDVLSAMDREAEAATSFGRAAALVEAEGPGSPAWTLHLLRGGALEQAGRWAEAEPVLERALALAPGNPVVLNYLGYARLERGGDLRAAEALIARASALRPNDPSITDSLGWAQYRQGRFAEAIATLGRAAAGAPGQAEIHEHLGDALFAAGRRYEARFAWEAARLVANDQAVETRIQNKLASGLLAPATTVRR